MLTYDLPVRLGRRSFFHCSLCASGAWLLGCGPPSEGPADGGPCDDAFRGGTLLGVVPFAGEPIPLGVRRGEGWDGRLYADLLRVPEEPVQANDAFYLRTFEPDLLPPTDRWSLRVDGLVEAPRALDLETLRADVRPMGVHVLECSGNGRAGGFGLMSAAAWSGVPVTEILARLDVSPSATRVLISGFDEHSVPSVDGHSTPGASWVLSFAELEETGAFLATEMNGAPLPPDHGAPLRLYVPGWYGCACIKWVDALTLVGEDVPATSQMQEFASRTHQDGVPALARDYRPPRMDQAAMPVRIEKWEVEGRIRYRVLGVLWGGARPTDALLFFDGASDPRPVEVCPPPTQNATWTLWQHAWEPHAIGRYELTMRVDDRSIPTRRLDTGYYMRAVDIDEV